MRLSEFPSGQSLFIDTNCLVYHFLGTHPACTLTVHRAELGDLRLITSTVVVSEVRHRLMILEGSQRFGLAPRKVVTFLKRYPDRIRVLRVCGEAINSLRALRVEALPLTAELILAGQAISQTHGLLTTDGLIVATMAAHRLTHLATNDRDFRRVPHLTLWSP